MKKAEDHLSQANRQFGLDAVRAFAILLVMLAHFITPILPDYGSPHSMYLVLSLFGLFGVEVFFALSGFLIGGILLRHDYMTFPAIRTFWMRRWLRTLPLYFFFLIFKMLRSGVSPNIIFIYPLFLQMWYLPSAGLALQNYFAISWSLAVEEWFYLLLPLVFLAIGMTKENRLVRLVGLYLALVVFSIAVVFLLDVNQQAAHGATWLRFDALLTGVVARTLLPHLSHQSKIRLAYGGLALLFAMFALWAHVYPVWPETPQNSFIKYPLHHVLPLGVACLLPLVATWRETGLRWLNNTVYWVAMLSYPIYIIHVDVSKILEKFFHGSGFVFIAFAVCFAVAAILHFAIERPVLRWRDRVYIDEQDRAAMPRPIYGAGLVLVLCLAASLWSNPQILPGRYCPQSRLGDIRDHAAAVMAGTADGPEKLAYETLLACGAQKDGTSYKLLGDAFRLEQVGFKNPAMATAYYERAAELGSAASAFEAATAYRTGNGVPLDLDKARTLYRKAAAAGDERAQKELEHLQGQ